MVRRGGGKDDVINLVVKTESLSLASFIKATKFIVPEADYI